MPIKKQEKLKNELLKIYDTGKSKIINMKNIANTELCNEKYSNCKECIKQYFERKSKE